MKKERRIAWACLIASGLIEVVWTYFMKLSHGFTIPGPAVISIIFLIISFFLLERGFRAFGIGLTYAVFTGMGLVGTTVVSIVLLNEGINPAKIIFLGILLVGIIGLKFCEDREAAKTAEKERD